MVTVASEISGDAPGSRPAAPNIWTGRFIEAEYPDYPTSIPEAPYAIQVSSSTSLLIQGERGGTGMALQNPREFYDLANGHPVSNEPLPATQAGDHLRYIRQLMIESDIYARSIARAMDQSKTQAEYANDSLSLQLRAIARLINGGLRTGMYIVTLSGFDTHYGQAEPHTLLLKSLSQALGSFMQDIASAGNSHRVVCLTYSEFGRRLSENGSAGTDHGAAAPQFVIGSPVQGGTVIGGTPDLENLDGRGDVIWKIDFRQLYATILEDWLEFDHAATTDVLGSEFVKLPLFRHTLDDVTDRHHYEQSDLVVLGSLPNPASSHTRVSFILPKRGFIRLNLFTMDGHVVMEGVNRELGPGKHELVLNVSALAADDYLCLLEFSGIRKSLMVTVMR